MALRRADPPSSGRASNRVRCAWVLLAWCSLSAGAATAAAASAAADGAALLVDLEQRLARQGVEGTNAHLSAHWPQAMVPLNRRTAACELRAVSLSVHLSRSAQSRAAQAHAEALRAASGQCTRFVLALAAPRDIPIYCGSVATWTLTQTARELRRRMAAIDADDALRSNPRGQACRAAYLHELQNTRVGVRPVAAARAASR